MGRLVCAVCVASSASCAQLAGIDETTKDPGAVELSFQRLSIGATIVTAPLDLTGQTASWVVDDAAEPTGLRSVAGAASADGTWTAEIGAEAAAAPRVEFTLPELPQPIRRRFDFPNRTVLGVFGVFEHPNPKPADMTETITLQMQYEAGAFAGEGIQVFTLGSWNIRGIAEVPAVGVPQIGPVALAYSSFGSLVGRPLEKLTASDAVLVLRYQAGTNNLTGVYEQPPFDQSGTDVVMGTFSTVAHDQTLDATIDLVDLNRRYGTVRPAVVVPPSMVWTRRAAPGFQSGNDLGPLLQAAVPAATDTKIAASYGNPFTANHDWRTVLTWSTQANRSVVPPGQTLAVTLSAAMLQRAFPSPGLALTLPAGLPQLITLDGTALTSDGQMIRAPTRAVTVTFATDIPLNTFYQLQVFDIVPNMAATALEPRTVFLVAGIEPKFVLPPDLFVVGHNYALRAITVQGGHPRIDQGDLQTRELPFAVSLADSGVFQVMP
jgi:hypothetical protein